MQTRGYSSKNEPLTQQDGQTNLLHVNRAFTNDDLRNQGTSRDAANKGNWNGVLGSVLPRRVSHYDDGEERGLSAMSTERQDTEQGDEQDLGSYLEGDPTKTQQSTLGMNSDYQMEADTVGGEFGFVSEMLQIVDHGSPLRRTVSEGSGVSIDSLLDSMEVPHLRDHRPPYTNFSLDRNGDEASENTELKKKRLKQDNLEDIGAEAYSSFTLSELSEIARIMEEASEETSMLKSDTVSNKAISDSISLEAKQAIPPHLNQNKAYSSSNYKTIKHPASAVYSGISKSTPQLTLEDRIGIRRMISNTSETAALTRRSGTLWSRLTAPPNSQFLAASGELRGIRGSAHFKNYFCEAISSGYSAIDSLLSGRGLDCPTFVEHAQPCIRCELPVYRRFGYYESIHNDGDKPACQKKDWATSFNRLGLLPGDIVELCGSTGSGKSHFCHQLALMTAMFEDPNESLGNESMEEDMGSVCYIDSGPHFSGRRLLEMAKAWKKVIRPETSLRNTPHTGSSQSFSQGVVSTKKPTCEVSNVSRKEQNEEEKRKGENSPELYPSPSPDQTGSEFEPLEKSSDSQRTNSQNGKHVSRRPFSPFYRHISPRVFASSHARQKSQAGTDLYGSQLAPRSGIHDSVAIDDAFHSQLNEDFERQGHIGNVNLLDLKRYTRAGGERDNDRTHISSSIPKIEETLKRIQRFECSNLFQLFTVLSKIRNQLDKERSRTPQGEYLPGKSRKLRLIIVDSVSTLLGPLSSTQPVSWSLFVSALGAQLRQIAKEYMVSIIITNSQITTFAPNLINYEYSPENLSQNLNTIQKSIGATTIKAPALGTAWQSVCDTRIMHQVFPQDYETPGKAMGKMTVVRAKCGKVGSSASFTFETLGIVPYLN